MNNRYVQFAVRCACELAVLILGLYFVFHWNYYEDTAIYNDKTAMYETKRADFREVWQENVLDMKEAEKNDKRELKVLYNNVTDADKFKTVAGCEIVGQNLTEMCVCIDGADTWMDINTCILEKTTPVRLYPWSHVSNIMIIATWFGYSCGSAWISVGTDMWNQTPVLPNGKWPVMRTIGAAASVVGCLVCGGAFIIGFIFGFKEGNQTAFSEIYLPFFFATVGFYTLIHKDVVMSLLSEVMAHVPEQKTGLQQNEAIAKFVSATSPRQHFLFYFNLLLVVPVIAMLLHVTHHWYDKDHLANTIFLLLTIVSVDAFSMHITARWETQLMVKQMNHDSVVQIGIMKLLSFIINLVVIFLLMTINYPQVVDQAILGYGLFTMLVIYLVFTFLIPDVVREFTHIYSINALSLRICGEFILRVIMLVYFGLYVRQELIANGADLPVA
jgi:hypothetical protein